MQNSQLILLKTKIPLLLWIIYGVVGLVMTPQYGVSWDEMAQREHGLVAFDHVVKTLAIDAELYYPDKNQQTTPGRNYTVLFSLTAAVVERVLGIGADDIRGQLLLRHYMVFLLFWMGIAFFYKLLKIQSARWALWGSVALVLSPRIFGHSFFNPKDIVLLVFYLVGAYTMVKYINRPTIRRALIHGVACGLVVNARQPGAIIFVATIFLILLDVIQHHFDKKTIWLYAKGLPALLFTALATAIMLFPYLWTAPLANGAESFELMAKFPWESPVLFMGQFINADRAPWYYIFVWIGITTPILYLLMGILGFGRAISQQVMHLINGLFWADQRELVTLSFLILFVAPIVAVFVFQSTLYDGWRHLFFIYPPLLGLGVYGWDFLYRNIQTNLRKWMTAGGVIYLLFVLLSMIKIHPFEYVYFNALAQRPLQTHYEMDYWGVSYKQAFEALVAKDRDTSLIHVNCANHPGVANYYFLPEKVRSRMRLRFGMEVAHYYLTNYRFPYELNRFLDNSYPFNRPFLEVRVYGEPINGAFRVIPRSQKPPG